MNLRKLLAVFIGVMSIVGTAFAQNTSNRLTITIDPKAIYFDVKTVNDWTDGVEGTLTVE